MIKEMIKASMWKGEDLKGLWDVTIKIDGVRVLFTDQGPVSRKGKPLYNIPLNHNLKDAEVYLGDFKSTISAVRTKNTYKEILPEHLYSLDPLDKRLLLASSIKLDKETIMSMFKKIKEKGYEGLVLRQNKQWLKVKPEETYDVVVTGWEMGKGKHANRMGALTTTMGRVGTGFTDKEREEITKDIIGETIEVSCMSLTSDGKFRHPRFVRIRYDK